MQSVAITFPKGVDVAGWSTSHRAGERPDLWPYGLNHLARDGTNADLSLIAAPDLSAREAVRALLSPMKSIGAADRDKSSLITITWDELTAVKALRQSAPGPLYAGIIWATDSGRGARDALKRLLVKRNLGSAAGLWCLSRPQVELASRWLGSGAPPVSFLQFGIDHQFYSLAPYPERPVVVSVGGDRDRDTATLFKALGKIHSAYPAAELVVQTKSTLKPPQGVMVRPYLRHQELRELYRRASVVAIATKPNNHVSGMTVSLEAMATGRPVVMTRTPGINDYVDNDSGLLATAGKADDLADRILDLLRSPKHAAQMGLNGRAKVEREHTSVGMARELSKIIGISDAE